MNAAVCELDVAAFTGMRPRLVGIATRVLGGAGDADDVVQETWLRWQRTERGEVRDPAAFLATTTTRLAINVTRSAHARRETAPATPGADRAGTGDDPARGLERREGLTAAAGLLLGRLSPTERAVYVLREGFDYPYRLIAEVLSLQEANARQLVLRARRRLTGGVGRQVGATERERLVAAITCAAQTGELVPLERMLVADCRSQERRVAA